MAPQSPPGARSAQASSKDAASSMCTLLLNTETKDEGEEFLDYSFSHDEKELQGLLPMKGVLLASCGVMRAAVGEDVTFFVFWSADGSRQYKVSILKIESWILCIALPGFVLDRVSQFFIKEAAGLIALRHGRLLSLQGHFKQLDPIFKALGNVWRGLALHSADTDVFAGRMYISFDVALWSSLAESWKDVVKRKVAEWEARWQEMAQRPRFAIPEGFALFLGPNLFATSLVNHAFEACLRLCVLEGVLDSSKASDMAFIGDDSSDNVRCHSLFMAQDETGPCALPSHQYSILQRGPWFLFMLWRIAPPTSPAQEPAPPAAAAGGARAKGAPAAASPARGAAAGERSPAVAAASGSDPFGIDISIDLLESLPLPAGYVKKSALTRPSRSGGSGGRDGGKRFSIPCPGVFKPLARGHSHRAAEHPPAFLYAMAVQDVAAAASSTASPSPQKGSPPAGGAPGFGKMQEPRQAAKDHLPAFAQVSCPEMSRRAAARKCLEWTPWEVRAYLPEWCALAWLVREHVARRAAWRKSPSQTVCRHTLLGVVKGKNGLDRLWEECLEGTTLMGDAGGQGGAQGGKRNPNVTRLGDGDPWRFQAGAPFFLSDLARLVSIGSLTGAGSLRAWSAVTEVHAPGRPSAERSASEAQHSYAFLCVDARNEPAL